MVGLAILSALYFSQARDLRRLREWAGRAPERSEGAARPDDAPTAADGAGSPTTAAAAPAVGAATGSPAAVAAASPAAAAARPLAATAPAVSAPGPAATPVAAPGALAGEAPVPVAGATTTVAEGSAGAVSAARTPAAAEMPAGAASSAAGTASPPPGAVRAGSQATPLAPAPHTGNGGSGPPPVARLPASQPAARRPPPAGAAPPARSPWYGRFPLRYAALLLVGLLVIGGGALYAFDRFAAEPAPSPRPAVTTTAAPSTAPVRPADVTVAVLNGTPFDGLARRLGDRVETAGFGLGNVATSSQQDRAESVVLYVADRRREARAVSERLGISQIERAGPDVTSLAGEADVVVVAGADQAP